MAFLDLLEGAEPKHPASPLVMRLLSEMVDRRTSLRNATQRAEAAERERADVQRTHDLMRDGAAAVLGVNVATLDLMEQLVRDGNDPWDALETARAVSTGPA